MKINLENSTQVQNKKYAFNLNTCKKDGLVLKIENNINDKNYKRFIRICRTSINSMGHILAILDQLGNIYLVNFVSNKFWLSCRFSNALNLKFSTYRAHELFLCNKNFTVELYNIEMDRVITKLTGHRNVVLNLSFFGNNCISFSCTEAIIWDLVDFQKIRRLEVENNNYFKFVVVIPQTPFIMTCFQDNVLQIWKASSFNLYKQIEPENFNNIGVKTIAFTKDGEIMAVAGHSPIISSFFTSTWTKLQQIKLNDSVKSVKKLKFLLEPIKEYKRVLVVLAGMGNIYFFDFDGGVVLRMLQAESEVSRMGLCPKGKFFTCLTHSNEMLVYNIPKFLESCSRASETITNAVQSREKFQSLKNLQERIVRHHLQPKEELDLGKLQNILKSFYEYPGLYRKTLWINILNLPNDKVQYALLMEKRCDNPFKDLEEKYPIENKQDLKNLKRLLSNIVAWCPFMADVEYLPTFVFPFARYFCNEPIICLELITLIIVNYCQHWFEYHPLPPINILGLIENILWEHDPHLADYLICNNVTTDIYAWPLLYTSYSEVLTSANWLAMWDHILSNEPSFLLMSVVAYQITNKKLLFSLKSKDEFIDFYRNPHAFGFKRFIDKTYDLLARTSVENHPRKYLHRARKFKHPYPVFSGAPKVPPNYLLKLKDLRLLSADYLGKEQNLLKDLLNEVQDEQTAKKASVESLALTRSKNACLFNPLLIGCKFADFNDYYNPQSVAKKESQLLKQAYRMKLLETLKESMPNLSSSNEM